MHAVSIDVSKGKSMVAIMRPFGEIVSRHFEIKYTTSDIYSLVELINSVEGESRIVMEHTGRYYEVFAHQLSVATFSSVPLIQSLSRTLITTLFIKLNLIWLMPLWLHVMYLTSGKILNSIVLWIQIHYIDKNIPMFPTSWHM